MLSKFKTMWDARCDCINVLKQWIELLHDTVQPIKIARCCAGRKTRTFGKVAIDKILEQEIIEPAQNELTAPVVPAPMKDGTLRFCVDRKRHKALKTEISTPYHVTKNT